MHGQVYSKTPAKIKPAGGCAGGYAGGRAEKSAKIPSFFLILFVFFHNTHLRVLSFGFFIAKARLQGCLFAPIAQLVEQLICNQ